MGKKKTKATAIGVLGMHRSGTSLITRVVNRLGAYVGEPQEMMPAQPDNPEGFWEHNHIYELHERLLDAMQRSWDTAIPLPAGWHRSSELASFGDELAELISTHFAGHQLWAWKDPRTCILLPLWKDVLERLDIELRCLLVARNPLDVARSLEKRNGFSLEESFGLWLNHNLAMLQNSAELPRVIVDYPAFLRDWEASLAQWAPRLSLQWPPEEAAVKDAIRDSIRPDLCHSASTLRDLSKVEPPRPVIELARILNTMTKKGDLENPVYETKVRRLLETHTALSRLFVHDFARAQKSNVVLQQQLIERDRLADASGTLADDQRSHDSKTQVIGQEPANSAAWLKRELEKLQSQRADYEKALAKALTQSEVAERRLQARDLEVTGIQSRRAEDSKALADARQQKEEAERRVLSRDRDIQDLRDLLASHEKELSEARVNHETIERRLEARNREIEDANGHLIALEKELAEARNQREAADAKLGAFEQELVEISAQIDQNEQQLAEARGLIAERDSALEALHGKADEIWMQLLREREEVESRRGRDEKALAQVRDLAERRKEELQELQQTADQVWMALEAERAQTKARFDRIHATYSWRITRPLRTVLDSVKSSRDGLVELRRNLGRKMEFGAASPAKLAHRGTAIVPFDPPESSDPPELSDKVESAQFAIPEGAPVPKVIAFYLPQFHPIPENDAWWGRGFTEWTNVAKAHALFDSHHQPRQPTDLGYYDLRLPEVREAQAELARAHGIHGFCYHYYWFDGKRLLERPLDDMLDSGLPDFPFCLSWANESWTRRWDGSEKDILMAQNYVEGFAQRFAEDAVRYLKDPRYIRIGDRPLLIVYRVDQIPDPERMIETWRQVFRDQGVGEVLLGAVECFDMINPTRLGFDVGIEFPPHNATAKEIHPIDPEKDADIKNLNPEFTGLLRDYRDAVRARVALEPAGYPLFRGVMPSWDNTARTGPRAMVYHHASPGAYQQWLTEMLKSATAFSAPHEPVVFVNAWNEWAEGAYLEPDVVHGHDYLLATRAAMDTVCSRARPEPVVGTSGEEQPEVSIIIPAFNQAHLTRSCLDSLRRHDTAVPFEVLVVDDASTDDTAAIADDSPWVRYFRQQQNSGFGAACNCGAAEARGSYLVFLNNDTTVCDGWLDALHGTFENWPKAGLVGSKLVLMDGTMQECGSLLFEDGSASNYGRGGDPRDPRYCYTRESDYVSGAAIMIRKDVFQALHGFDDIYEPAYYEDTDLALRVREMGLQVIVNPHAEVHHVEGGTAGTDTSKGIKRYQIINQAKFLARWKATLAGFPARPAGEPGIRKTRPKVLVVDWIVPRPDRDSGSLRMTGILRALRRLDCHVTLMARDLSCETGYEIPLERIGIEVLRQPYFKSIDRYLAEFGDSFDFVIVSRRDTANLHIDSITRHCSNARIVFDTCDLHFIRESRQAEIDGTKVNQRKLDAMRSLELDLIQRSNTTLVVSPEERDVLNEMLPEQDVRIVSNILDVQPTTREFPERAGLLFIGWFLHTPNVDGVLWFINEVLPELARRGLEPVFHIVGSDPTPELLALGSEQIKIHGYVPNVEPLFDACRLSVAPLRYGAGVKGKINQSMALGVPCVTTSIGAEGVFIENEVNGMVADDAIDFASRIESAYQSEELWTRLREQGLKNIQQHFSLEVATAILRDLIFEPAQKPQANAGSERSVRSSAGQ